LQINKQDALTSEAKKVWDELEEDVKFSQQRNIKATHELNLQDGLYHDVKYEVRVLCFVSRRQRSRFKLLGVLKTEWFSDTITRWSDKFEISSM